MEKFDFDELAKEAAKTVYNPRAKRCWFFHNWSMWDVTTGYQIRRCIRCGRRQYKKLPMIVCDHLWTDIRTGGLSSYGTVIGHFHDQKCARCGGLRHVELRNGTSADAT